MFELLGLIWLDLLSLPFAVLCFGGVFLIALQSIVIFERHAPYGKAPDEPLKSILVFLATVVALIYSWKTITIFSAPGADQVSVWSLFTVNGLKIAGVYLALGLAYGLIDFPLSTRSIVAKISERWAGFIETWVRTLRYGPSGETNKYFVELPANLLIEAARSGDVTKLRAFGKIEAEYVSDENLLGFARAYAIEGLSSFVTSIGNHRFVELKIDREKFEPTIKVNGLAVASECCSNMLFWPAYLINTLIGDFFVEVIAKNVTKGYKCMIEYIVKIMSAGAFKV
jgi:hypothetical protein